MAVAYGVSGPARRVLALWALGRGPEHRTRAGDEHSRMPAVVPDRLDQRRGRAADRGQRLRWTTARTRARTTARRGGRARPEASRNRVPEALGVEQVAFDELDPLAVDAQLDPALAARAPNHPCHSVAALEQQLGEERPVLAGDAGHERTPRLGRADTLRLSDDGLASDRVRASCGAAPAGRLG